MKARLEENTPATAIKNPIAIVIGINSKIKILVKSETGENCPKLKINIGKTAICAEEVVKRLSFQDKNPGLLSNFSHCFNLGRI